MDNIIKIFSKFDTGIDAQKAHLIDIKQLSPDNFLYTININENSSYWIYEVDYISDLDLILKTVRAELGDVDLIPVKSKLIFENAWPVLSSLTYVKPDDWNNIQIYVSDDKELNPIYFKFLMQTKYKY